MKKKEQKKMTKNNTVKIKGIKLDARTEGSCYVTMQTNAGELTVYIDSMDGLTDPPMVSAWIPGREDKEINLTHIKKNKPLKLTGYGWGNAYHKNKLDDLPLGYIKKYEAFLRKMKMTLPKPFESKRLDKKYNLK